MHHNEFFGNALILIGVASLFLKERLLDEWMVLAGISISIIAGAYFRLAPYFYVRNNKLRTQGEYGMFSKKIYNLEEIDSMLVENDRLFLCKSGVRIELSIHKSRASEKDWDNFVVLFVEKGLLKVISNNSLKPGTRDSSRAP